MVVDAAIDLYHFDTRLRLIDTVSVTDIVLGYIADFDNVRDTVSVRLTILKRVEILVNVLLTVSVTAISFAQVYFFEIDRDTVSTTLIVRYVIFALARVIDSVETIDNDR